MINNNLRKGQTNIDERAIVEQFKLNTCSTFIVSHDIDKFSKGLSTGYTGPLNRC